MLLLLQLLQEQTVSKDKLPDGTVPEVFIIESLTLTDENKGRREGEVLASILRICNKKPLYYYVRTRRELDHLADEFEASGYRYLHISCHGGDDRLETTLDSISYSNFAEIFASRLSGRRLFMSACHLGNEIFSETVRAKNPGILSVAAPVNDIDFDVAVAFWSAFYVKVFKVNARSMSSKVAIDILRTLCTLFNARLHWSHGKLGKPLKHQIIDA